MNADRASNYDGNLVLYPMKMSSERPKTKLYSVLFAVQMLGAITFVWQELPEFRQVVDFRASNFRMTPPRTSSRPVSCW